MQRDRAVARKCIFDFQTPKKSPDVNWSVDRRNESNYIDSQSHINKLLTRDEFEGHSTAEDALVLTFNKDAFVYALP